MKTNERQFTVADGLAVQTEQLKRWQYLLKPEIFAQVQFAVAASNLRLDSQSTGYDVMRGVDIDAQVSNIGYAQVPAQDRS